ncbi:MAG: CsgG/HfaB family protein [Geminicoccaceae bacterium]
MFCHFASVPRSWWRFDLLLLPLIIGVLAGCAATESHQAVETQKVATYRTAYDGPRYALVISNFANSSSYQRGAFSDGVDRLGGQAKTILKTHLQQTNRFSVVDRDNLETISQEAELRGVEQKLKGAEVAITGAVTEFGRRETGDRQLFGILGRAKSQLAYSKVALNVVDTTTGEVIHSTQGAGEYQLDNREVVGFGGTAGYDATLNGKVLNLAITEAVEQLVVDLENGLWSPTGEG